MTTKPPIFANKKSPVALRRLLLNAAAITLFATPYVVSMIPTKAAATDWTFDFGTSTAAASGSQCNTAYTLWGTTGTGGGTVYERSGIAGSSLVATNPGNASLGTGSELALTAISAAGTLFSIRDWTVGTGFDVRFSTVYNFAATGGAITNTLNFYVGNSSTMFSAASGQVGADTSAGLKINSTSAAMWSSGDTWTIATGSGTTGLAANSVMNFRVIGNQSGSTMNYTLDGVAQSLANGTVDYFFYAGSSPGTWNRIGNDLSMGTTAADSMLFQVFGGSSLTTTVALDNIAYSNSIPAYVAGGTYWNGGVGSWSTSSSNWSTTSGSSFGSVTQDSGSSTPLVFGGTSAGTVTVTNTVTSAAGMTFSTTGYSITGGTINLTGTSATANTITIDGASSSAIIASTLSGTNGLTKAGSGSLMLSGTNTYSGSTAIAAGTLKAGSAAAFGTSTITITAGATLDLNGQSVNANRLTINGTGAASAGGALVNSVSTAGSFAGAITLGSASTIAATSGNITLSGGIALGANTLTIDGANNTTIGTAAISGTGALNKIGTGTLNLNFANSYSGATTVTGGTLAAVAGALGGTSGITVNTGAKLTAVDFKSGIALTVNGTGIATITGTAAQTVGAIINGGTTTFNGTYAVTAASLTGTGSSSFGNNLTLTGATAFSQGTANVTGNFQSTSASLTGGTVNVTGTTNIATLSGATVTSTGAATVTSMTLGTLNAKDTATISGGISGGTLNVTNALNNTAISGSAVVTAGSLGQSTSAAVSGACVCVCQL